MSAEPAALVDTGPGEPRAIVAGAAPVPSTRAHRRRLPSPVLGALLPLAVLALAEIAARRGWIGANLLPAPSDVVQALLGLGWRTVAGHVAISTARVLAGFALGAGLALAVGALVGLSRARRPCSTRASRRCARFRRSRGCRCCCCGWASTRRPSSC